MYKITDKTVGNVFYGKLVSQTETHKTLTITKGAKKFVGKTLSFLNSRTIYEKV